MPAITKKITIYPDVDIDTAYRLLKEYLATPEPKTPPKKRHIYGCDRIYTTPLEGDDHIAMYMTTSQFVVRRVY